LGSNYHEQGTHSREEIIATNEVVPSIEASPVTSLSLNFANLSEVTGTIEPNVVTEECNQLLPSANPSPRIGLNQEQNSVGSDHVGQHTSQGSQDIIDPMDAFLHSGTNHIEQPLLPDPVQVEASQIELLEDIAMPEFTQRKSSRLANKAKSRVGKDTLMVA